MRLPILFLTTALLTAAFATSYTSLDAAAADSKGPARLEKIPGSDIPKVVLTPDAAKRLGIQTTVVQDVAAKRWRLAIGVVEQTPADGVTPTAISEAVASTAAVPPAPGPALWVKLLLTEEGGLDAKEVRLLIRRDKSKSDELADDDFDDIFDDLDGDDESEHADANDTSDDDPDDNTKVTIIPIDTATISKRYSATAINAADSGSSGIQYYAPVKTDDGLVPGQRVFVHMIEPKSKLTVKTIPYSSVIYKDDGSSWIFVTANKNEFTRYGIEIEKILGSTVVLAEGPPAGTAIVSVGAAELMGVEQLIGH